VALSISKVWADSRRDPMSKIADRLARIRDNIAAACERARRDPAKITTVIVTKTAPLESIFEVIRQGCLDLGENRVQNLKHVAEQVERFLAESDPGKGRRGPVRWHMIGHLQRNKVKSVLRLSSIIHSVDTLRLAEEINTCAGKQDLCPHVLLQVNCSGEPQKYGVPVGAAVPLAEQIATMPNLRLVGLMTMAPLTRNKDVVRACFARARELFEEIRKEAFVTNKFVDLSMGMSQDYEIAVEEGATILRIGSAVFA